MMSRAYWIGLMPRSLSRVRSQPSRPMPNRRGDDLDLLIDLGGRDLQLLAARGPGRSACG